MPKLIFQELIRPRKPRPEERIPARESFAKRKLAQQIELEMDEMERDIDEALEEYRRLR